MKTRKFFAVLAAAAMCVTLVTGFGGRNAAAADDVTPESLLNDTFEAMGDVKSASYELTMNMDMTMAIFGFSQKTDMEMDIDIQIFGDNAYAAGTMTNCTLEDGEEVVEEQSVRQYAMLEGEEYVFYSYDEETDSWSKWTSDKPAYTLDMLPRFESSSFTLEEEDTQYALRGKIDLLETIAAMPDMFSDFTEAFGGYGELTGEADVIYTFDKKTKELTSVSIDLSEAMRDIMDNSIAAMKESMGEYYSDTDLDSLFSVNFRRFAVEIKGMVFNQGSEIVLPDEAKDAQLETDDEEESEGVEAKGTVPSGFAG